MEEEEFRAFERAFFLLVCTHNEERSSTFGSQQLRTTSASSRCGESKWSLQPVPKSCPTCAKASELTSLLLLQEVACECPKTSERAA